MYNNNLLLLIFIVLWMGAVVAFFGSFFHWFPLFTGLMMNSKWLKIHLVVMFIGVNLTFFPQHMLSLGGMPRRYTDYPDVFYGWNVVSTMGSQISVISLLLVIFSLYEGLISTRLVLFTCSIGSYLEWRMGNPPSDHTNESTYHLSIADSK